MNRIDSTLKAKIPNENFLYNFNQHVTIKLKF